MFDVATALAGLSGAAAKIATDVLLLMQSEVGEAFEPSAPGKGGSSTLPHKRNPVGAAAIRANHRRVVGLMATMTMALEQEHERAAGAWAAEWETLRDLFMLTAGSVERLKEMLSGLEVDPARMRENLDATLGLPLAESLMMTLAPKIGRMEAHHRVEAASKLALASNRSLAEVAKAEPAIAGNVSAEEIDRALDPRNYLGTADVMIDAALQGGARRNGGEVMAEVAASDGSASTTRPKGATTALPSSSPTRSAPISPCGTRRRRKRRASASASSATISAAMAGPQRPRATTRSSGWRKT